MLICKTAKPCINSRWIALLIHGFMPVKTWLSIACDTAFYAIIFVVLYPFIENLLLFSQHHLTFPWKLNWPGAWQNQQNDLCKAKTQISLGICPVWSVFAVCMKKSWALSFLLSTQGRLCRSADLSHRWAHIILLVLSCCDDVMWCNIMMCFFFKVLKYGIECVHCPKYTSLSLIQSWDQIQNTNTFV